MGPSALNEILKPLSGMFLQKDHPDLLVGLDVSDDAAVYRINDHLAAVLTLDFFTPVVDDPFSYGSIAAANALSDIYAMGARVSVALNICAFPEQMESAIITEILKGGGEKVRESGGVLAGGHTVVDKEPKYGLSVMGLVDPACMMTKDAARPGDVLILTKPLGSGIITTSAKANEAQPEHLALAIETMSTLNRVASEILVHHQIACCTDVTGFGLLGHASEVASKSQVKLVIQASALPFIEGAQNYAEQWLFPSGTSHNRKSFECGISTDSAVKEECLELMHTPETSGGLLSAIPPEKLGSVLDTMRQRGVPVWVIGEVQEGAGIQVRA